MNMITSKMQYDLRIDMQYDLQNDIFVYSYNIDQLHNGKIKVYGSLLVCHNYFTRDTTLAEYYISCQVGESLIQGNRIKIAHCYRKEFALLREQILSFKSEHSTKNIFSRLRVATNARVISVSLLVILYT